MAVSTLQLKISVILKAVLHDGFVWEGGEEQSWGYPYSYLSLHTFSLEDYFSYVCPASYFSMFLSCVLYSWAFVGWLAFFTQPPSQKDFRERAGVFMALLTVYVLLHVYVGSRYPQSIE